MSYSPKTGSLRLGLAGALALATVAAWCGVDWYVAIPSKAQATFVGRDSCIVCHQAQYDTWHGSDHDRAMELATEDSVLGDFNDAAFERFGVATRFFRRDDKFFVNTEGPDGQLHDYEIKYTFGIQPLQQYMVELPDGRVQVLRESWNTERGEWFFVTPPDVPDERIEPGDPLHWTGLGQNWNTMCAECHSTNLEKNYDLATNTYHTTFSEIDVSCEACHGPGSLHVAQAESFSLFWDRNRGYALNKLQGGSAEHQIETCAPCHSRREQIHANFHAGDDYFDHFKPSLIDAGLYHADGQMLDEVYVYGSFLQSKMHAKGVRCTDCHNPHSLKLKYTGNRLCAQCHQPGRYDAPSHHHHTDAAATQCVACHMPEHTYMVIDGRRDHQFAVPRPDLTVDLGTPNACSTCHDRPEETAEWAAASIRNWIGERPAPPRHFAYALEAARRGSPDAFLELRRLLRRQDVAEIIRATALELLANYPSPDADALCREALDDASPLVRAAAVAAMSNESLAQFVYEVSKKLNDPAMMVRSAAARRLVQDAVNLKDDDYRKDLDQAIAEYRRGQEIMADRAASHLNLAELEESLGNSQATIDQLRTAIRLEPYLSGVRDKLAGRLEAARGDAREITRLREEEVALLERNTRLFPDADGPHYQRGMMLYLLGRNEEARQAFVEACRIAPDTYDNWLALVLICQKLERWQEAAQALQQMERLRPGDPAVRSLLGEIQAARESESETQ